MSLRKAIDQHCKSCVYDPLSGLGSWREQVARCVCTDCPLWPVRTGPRSGPYTRPGIDEEILSCGRFGASSGKDADERGCSHG